MVSLLRLPRLFLFGLMIFLVPSWANSADEKPNMIFILVDDLGYGDLGIHDNPRLQTPNIDQLSRESIRFDDHHVAPMCTPTRGELMTGLSAFRNGATAVAYGRSIPRRELPLMPEIFRENGYATAHFGKWHLGDNYPFRPHDRGFDHSIYSLGYGTSSLADHWKNDAFDDHYWRNGVLEQFKGYNTDVFFNEAISWMTEQKEPFFVYLATTASHEPHYVASSYSKQYEDLKDSLAAFYGMTTQLDENVGRLVKFLDESKLSKNTILIYMSDNGSVERTFYYTAGMRGRKGSLYDGGHKVPFFIRWPNGIDGKSRTIDTLTHGTDLLPTLIDLADLKVKDTVAFDGQSLAPLISGEENDLSERKVVIQFRDEFIDWDSTVLWKNWRLVKGKELYDISIDPGQRKNLAATRPDILKVLRDYYISWIKPTKEIMGQQNHIIIGSPKEKVTTLSSADWVGPFAGEWQVLDLTDPPVFGYWDIEVDKTTEYEFSLYMFPPESNTPLNQSFQNVGARPITGARLLLGDKEYVVKTSPDDTSAKFKIPLTAGDKLSIEGQFLDAEGNALMGIIYLIATPVT